MTDTPLEPTGGEATPPPQRDPEQPEHEGIRFRDNRRIDPVTFEPREPRAPVEPEPGPDAGVQRPAAADEARIGELTADLQRLSAEYANYRRRVDRDRDVARQLAVAAVMTDLLPVLDDIGRARGHGELDGGFKAVAEALELVTTKYGLESYAGVGEPFDPKVHEAMTSETSAEVTEPTVTGVYQSGYRIDDRILRAARVAVADTE